MSTKWAIIKPDNTFDHYLRLIPKIKEGQQWEIDDQGLVALIIHRNNVLDRLVRLFIKTPEVMRIHLDRLGSRVWQFIDGNRSVMEIGLLIEKEFADNAQPLYERLFTFLVILKNNGFICLEIK